MRFLKDIQLHVDNLIKKDDNVISKLSGLLDSNSQMQVPFIPSSKIKNIISQLSNKNKIQSVNHISKGQEYLVFNNKNASLNSSSSVSIGCSQDVQKTYYNLDLNPQISSPIKIY